MTPVLTTQDGLKYGERNTDQSVQHMFNTRAVPSSSTLAPAIARLPAFLRLSSAPFAYDRHAPHI